jgi:hypothetical protein
MNPDWKQILGQLNAAAPGTHNILGPCPEEHIRDVEANLGVMPVAFVEMLRCLNGAGLFLDLDPHVTNFGLSPVCPRPKFEWAPDWYIDVFTRTHRSENIIAKNEWAFAMMNYGGLLIANHAGKLKEWDTSRNTWSPGKIQLDDGIQIILSERRTELDPFL